MFKKILRKVIDRLEYAYKETYGEDVESNDNFYDEVSKRKEKNKNQFIRTMAGLAMIKSFTEGKPITPDEAENIAKNMFIIAKKQGNLDELNNLKGV